VSIEQKIDFVQELDESIREKSIQYFSDSKLCRLNSGHPFKRVFQKMKSGSRLIVIPHLLFVKHFLFNFVVRKKLNEEIQNLKSPGE
jgi:hypothetical protein